MHKKLPKNFVFLDQFDDRVFNNNITNLGIIYRNYENNQKINELVKIKKACKKRRYQLFISNDHKLFLKFKADGLYIPSFNKKKMGYLNIGNKNIIILGSAHNNKEIYEKIKQKCKLIFLSPLFEINKKNKKILGITRFNLLILNKKANFYALGGILKSNYSKLKMLNVKGFGGIRYFQKKTGPQWGRF